jgi:hypothetical protein
MDTSQKRPFSELPLEEPKPDKKAPKAVPLPVPESTSQAVAQPSSFGTDRP